MRLVYLFLCLAPFTLTAYTPQECQQEGRQLGYQQDGVRSDGFRVYFYGCQPRSDQNEEVKRQENKYLQASSDADRASAEKALNNLLIQIHVSTEKATATKPSPSSDLQSVYSRRIEQRRSQSQRQLDYARSPEAVFQRSDGVKVRFSAPTKNIDNTAGLDLLKNLYLRSKKDEWTSDVDGSIYRYESRDYYASKLKSKYGVTVDILP